jgi:hypothetical protein
LRGGRSGTHEEEREEAIQPHSEGGGSSVLRATSRLRAKISAALRQFRERMPQPAKQRN